MIVTKILRKDFQRKKIISIVVFTFILLSAVLVASGSNLIMDLSSSLSALFETSRAPHFVQMHAGDVDQAEIDRWAAANSLVKEQQTVEMVTVDGSTLYVGNSQTPEENGIMDISFVTQNSSFDFLLDLADQVIQVSPGEVAVPIYYMQRDNLQIGDTVRISDGRFEREFTIAAFVRDAQMNPSIVHSKRFLVHEDDYAALKEHFAETEYLIEFLLTDVSQVDTFSQAYQSSGLPSRGPSVDRNLFKSLNALTDGIVAGVVIVLSLLLMIIAILCLRFTILATIEEDTKEIGVMKAIGIARRDIKRIYLAKYAVMGVLASVLGYLASLFLNQALSGNIMLYLGSASKGLIQHAVPFVAASSIGLMVFVSCAVVLRRLNRITPVEALRSGTVGQSMKNLPVLDLKKSRLLDVNVFLGFRDVVQRFRLFGLLCFVFFFCAFVIIVPVHFLTTIQSPSFISYMGIGQSDIRIDLRQSEDTVERFESMVAYLADDPDVERFSPLVTSQFTMVGSDGARETINIETGDFSIFPLDYVEGRAPELEHEIALSSLNAREMEKGVGEPIVLLVDGQEQEMTVSGIYQDVTNGGRTAKAVLPYDPDNVLSYAVSLDLTSQRLIDEKVREYSEAFYPARVTDLEGYLAQTLGNTIDQLRKVTLVAVVVGLSVAVLITSLFLNMLVSKDASQIAIMRGLGFSLRDIRVQYLSRALVLLGLGIVLGTIFSNTLGQRLVSALWALMGASRIKFVIDPIQAYVLLPLLLMLAVSITSLISMAGIKETNIAEMIME
ncbi:MAG: FtsX-like permease family protein [Anaerolineae bacterium]